MKAFLDTSVLVAVFYGDHVHHAATTLTLPQIAARLHAGTWKSLNAKPIAGGKSMNCRKPGPDNGDPFYGQSHAHDHPILAC